MYIYIQTIDFYANVGETLITCINFVLAYITGYTGGEQQGEEYRRLIPPFGEGGGGGGYREGTSWEREGKNTLKEHPADLFSGTNQP